MNSGLNIVASIVSSSLGGTLLLVTLLHTRWLRKEKSKENYYLRLLIVVNFLTLLADPIAYATDGSPLPLMHVLCVISNTWLFLANVLVGLSWWKVILEHMEIRPNLYHRIIIYGLSGVGVLLLIVNFFYPVAFGFGEDHSYYRGPIFFYYLLLEGIFLADGLFLYLRARRRGGIFRTFPIWQFLIPILVGVCVQSFFYGVSTIPPCMAISTFNTVLGMQQDKLMRDKLTGVYNRYFMDYIREKVSGKKKGVYTVLMADLNGFKEINDSFGHAEGDLALANAALILKRAAGEAGTVLRYAGDEFIIFANEPTDEAGQQLRDRIKKEFDAYNSTSGKPYCLSCATGYSLFDVRKDSVDEVMKQVDELMYLDKASYHSSLAVNPSSPRSEMI